MIISKTLTPRQSLKEAFLKENISSNEIELFKKSRHRRIRSRNRQTRLLASWVN